MGRAGCHTGSRERRHNGRVDRKLRSIPQGHAVGNDLDAAVVKTCDRHIQIAHKCVTSDTGPRLPANTSCRSLERASPTPQSTRPSAGCSMVAKRVERGRRHRQLRADKGKGRRKRRNRRARKWSEGNVSSGQDGTLQKGRLLKGPVWDNKSAWDAASSCGSRAAWSCSAMAVAAGACQPPALGSGRCPDKSKDDGGAGLSSNSSQEGGRNPRRRPEARPRRQQLVGRRHANTTHSQ